MYLSNTGKVIFESSVFDSNYVEMNGECCNNYGGAITSWNNYDSLIVRNSKFRYNKVYKPPAIMVARRTEELYTIMMEMTKFLLKILYF